MLILYRVASVVGSTEYWLIMAGVFLLLAVVFIFKIMFFSANSPVELHEKRDNQGHIVRDQPSKQSKSNSKKDD